MRILGITGGFSVFTAEPPCLPQYLFMYPHLTVIFLRLMGLVQVLYHVCFVDTIRRPKVDVGAVALFVLFLCKSVIRRKHLCEESRAWGGEISSPPPSLPVQTWPWPCMSCLEMLVTILIAMVVFGGCSLLSRLKKKLE